MPRLPARKPTRPARKRTTCSTSTIFRDSRYPSPENPSRARRHRERQRTESVVSEAVADVADVDADAPMILDRQDLEDPEDPDNPLARDRQKLLAHAAVRMG